MAEANAQQQPSIFAKMFKRTDKAVDITPANNQQQQQQPTKQQAAEPAADSNLDKNGKMIGSDQNLSNDKNPLDIFSKMHENSNTDKEGAPVFALDDDLLGKVTDSLDFTKDLPPELLAEIEAGKPGAMLKAINLAGRAAYKTALSHSATITGKYLDHRSTYDNKNVDNTVSGKLISNELASIPNASHPVVKAEISRIAKLMQQDHPDATPQEIAAGVKDYMAALSSAISGKKDSDVADAETGAVDWKKYVGASDSNES